MKSGRPDVLRRSITSLAGTLAVVLGWSAGVRSRAQTPEFQIQTWHIEDGLPDGRITALAEAPDGCLWIGTPSGAARFDGARFKRLEGLPDPAIAGLTADPGGSLWLAGKSGTVVREGGDLTAAAAATLLPAWPPGDPADTATFPPWHAFNTLAVDAEGDLWQFHENFGCRRVRGDRGLEPIAVAAPPGGEAGAFLADAAGSLWLLRGNRVHHFIDHGWQEISATRSVGELQFPMAADPQTGVWIVAGEPDEPQRSLRHLTANGLAGENVKLPPGVGTATKPVSALLADRKGRFWLSDWWGGVLVRDRDGGWRQVAREGPLRRCVVTCLLEDRQGAIWVGTLGEGLHRISPKVVAMVVPPERAARALVVSVSGDPAGGLWLGAEGDGVYHFNNGQPERFGPSEGLTCPGVKAVLADRAGRVWVGTNEGLFQKAGDRFEVEPAITGEVLTLMEGSGGRLWLGDQSGQGALWCRDASGAWTKFRPDDEQIQLDIRSLAEAPDGGIWVATFHGRLWRVEGTRLRAADQAMGLSRTDLRSLYFDPAGGLWIGTLYGGLFHWANGHLRHLTREDGLADDSILGIADDGHDGLWFSSSNGVFGCSRDSLTRYAKGGPPLLCWRVTPEDGLGNRGCSGGGQPVISRLGDSALVVANMVGAAVIHPDEIARLGPATMVRVEAVTADGTALRLAGSEIRAAASTRRFEFRYAAPDLARARQQRFRYRLDPLDHDWLDAGDERMASYSRLEPGTYQFRVMVGGNDGVWRESAHPLALRVTPQFWQTRWFLPAIAVLVAALAAAAVVWNTRRKLRLRLARLEMRHALDRERARIARDIHDDLGTNLTEILLLSERSTTEYGAADARLQRIGGKTRALIQTLDEIVWAVGPKNDNLRKLADYLCTVTEELCESAGVRCWHEVPAVLPDHPLPVDYRHQVFLIVKEACNNALRHAGAAALWLRIEIAAGHLLVEVKDDGSGFDPASTTRPGNGLANMRSRTEAVGGTLSVHSAPDAGTTVRFEAPLPAPHAAGGNFPT